MLRTDGADGRCGIAAQLALQIMFVCGRGVAWGPAAAAAWCGDATQRGFYIYN